MEYQRKYNRKKAVFAVSISGALLCIVLLLSFLMSPAMVSSTEGDATPPPAATLAPLEGELVINDAQLANAIKKQLSLSSEPTKEDMERLKKLDYDETVITDLTGLQFAVNLEELRLKVDVVTADPIKALHINKLTLISDVSVQPMLDELKEMSYLRYLDLTDCGISSVGYISELPVLETLILDDNRITGLQYLSQMRTLSLLSVKNCGIKDMSGLSGNISIRSLYIDDNLVEDISVFDTMRSLETVTYTGNPIKSNGE